VKRLALILGILVVLFSSASIFGQTRIKFARGATSKIVTGSLNGYKSHRAYVIRVKRGQTLSTWAVKNHITIDVEAPPGSVYEQDRAADCGDKNEVNPTARGDYRITVSECMKADPWRGTFKFRVTVR